MTLVIVIPLHNQNLIRIDLFKKFIYIQFPNKFNYQLGICIQQRFLVLLRLDDQTASGSNLLGAFLNMLFYLFKQMYFK